MKSEGKKSAHDAETRANAFIIPTLGDIEVANLKSKTIRTWRDNLAATPARIRTKAGKDQAYKKSNDPETERKRKATVNRLFSTLRAALNHAFQHGRVSSDIEWRRVKAFRNVDAARLRYLTIEESTRLLNLCNNDIKLLVKAALLTGARAGELSALLAEDFNSDTGTIHIKQSKSGKARHIYLTDEGITFIKRQVINKTDKDFLFLRENGLPWKKNDHSRPFKEACDKANIKLTFHELRHTYASLSVMNSMPLMVLAKQLGHSDTRMVEKHYGHLSNSYVKDAIRASAPNFGFTKDNVTSIK